MPNTQGRDVSRPAPFLVADNRALDFLNTIAAPRATEFEWLENGNDLLDWLEKSGLVEPAILARFRSDAQVGRLDGVAAKARRLREWFRGFVLKWEGMPLRPSALQDMGPINEILAGDSCYRQITAGGSDQSSEGTGPLQFAVKTQRRWELADMLLIPIAEAMADLIGSVDFSAVKNCEGPTCTMMFHDVSKNHTRRWCSMAVCGNRAKAAAHRARQKKSSAATG